METKRIGIYTRRQALPPEFNALEILADARSESIAPPVFRAEHFVNPLKMHIIGTFPNG
jgi:hypothetical protein